GVLTQVAQGYRDVVSYHLSLLVYKFAFCICEVKDSCKHSPQKKCKKCFFDRKMSNFLTLFAGERLFSSLFCDFP
ncbi:MAG: hypothetical protein IKW46_03280, partial [Bacteroidaceae bacterium]|nr:hypothetical protein [Bacteroidaceae bacterium]